MIWKESGETGNLSKKKSCKNYNKDLRDAVKSSVSHVCFIQYTISCESQNCFLQHFHIWDINEICEILQILFLK